MANRDSNFDERASHIGQRFQPNKPLLHRDLNVSEDIRRHFERTLRLHYLGPGIPDLDGFRIRAPGFRAPNDFLIGAGRCLVNGYDVWNPTDTLYSEQEGVPDLPPPNRGDHLTVYLQPEVVRETAHENRALLNEDLHINMETCVRDKLVWRVRVVRFPEPPPVGSYPLAIIRRPEGAQDITDEMIDDRRRTELNLATVRDASRDLERRVKQLETALDALRLKVIDNTERLGRLLWNVTLKADKTHVLFGEGINLAATVKDGNGQPVANAELAFSADWGTFSSVNAVTDEHGEASTTLTGVHSVTPIKHGEMVVLDQIAQMVKLATSKNPGVIDYPSIKFEPKQLSVLSRYTPASILDDISYDLPTGPILEPAPQRGATITVHAKEPGATVVRGTGSIQVFIGLWIRDWSRSKIVDAIDRVEVSGRIGRLVARGVQEEGFDPGEVQKWLPKTLQDIQDDTERLFRTTILKDPEIDEAELTQMGRLGQIIAQETTTAVGMKSNRVLAIQIDKEVADPTAAKDHRTTLVQESSKISAGFSQNQRQRYSSLRIGT